MLPHALLAEGRLRYVFRREKAILGMARPPPSDHLHGAVHRTRVDHVLVEEEGRDNPRVPEQLARVPAGLVPAEDVLEVPLRDTVHKYLVTCHAHTTRTADGNERCGGAERVAMRETPSMRPDH